jgi:chromosome condensin MukBEF MukE localization factor
VPYGSLLSRALDGLLAAGRHISCDANSHGFMREIPQCWLPRDRPKPRSS